MTSIEMQKRYAAGERNFSGVDLRGQDLSGLDLSDADFSDADLRGTSFRNSTLGSALFCNARCGVLRHKMILMALLYVAIIMIAPVLYCCISFTFINGYIVFKNTLMIYICMLLILSTLKCSLKNLPAVFTEYGIDSFLFFFGAMACFIYYSHISDDGRKNIDIRYILLYTIAFSAFC